MHVTRIYTGPDGESHLEQIEVPLAETPVGRMTRLLAADGVMFRETSGDFTYDFHVAPRRQLAIILTGIVEIDCGNGEVCRIGPGQVLLADDTSGKGHISRDIEGPRQQVFVSVPAGVDVGDWLAGRAG